MKNLLKKLHIVSREFDDSDGSTKDSAPGKSPESSSHEKISPSLSCPSASIADVEPKVLSGFSGWLSSVTRHHYPSSNSSVVSSNASEAKRFLDSGSLTQLSSSVGETDLMSGLEADRACLSSPLLQEEYQIQLALALSAKEDPEAAQIEAVKQISLGSCPPLNTPSEVVAYRYWNYNALGYDDKILDGFYDLYGILTESTSREMPSLVDLQGVPLSDNINWEVVLVNRETDDDLSRLEGRALTLSVNSRFESHGTIRGDLLQGLAALVSNHMGGPVADPDSMLRSWKALSDGLRTRSGSMVLPLGSLTIGLARHRALLFKVLADAMGIPCRLVKGRQYTGSDDVSMNIVKVDDGREYIIDLMGAPGTLIPFDALGGQAVYEEAASCESSPDVGKLDVLLCTGKTSSADECSRYDNSEFNLTSGRCFPYDGDVGRGSLDETSATGILGVSSAEKEASTSCNSQEFRFDSAAPCESGEELKSSRSIKLNHPYTHTRSPSSTESINFPVVRSMKIKDVSQYMIDAAKENPQLAQKLCDVLRESGVVAPSNLFSEILTKSIEVHGNEEVELPGEGSNEKNKNAISDVAQGDAGAGSLLSSQISPGYPSKAFLFGPQMIQQKPVEGLGTYLPLDIGSMNTASHHVPPIEASGFPLVAVQEKPILKIRSRVPVAAVAATAVVVASPMVVAATKSSTDSNMEVPVAAAATATAAAVVATTAAVSCQYEQLDHSLSHFPLGALYGCVEDFTCTSDREVEILHKRNTQEVLVSAAEEWTNTPYRTTDRELDKSVGNESVRSDGALDDVAEFEILWEEITLGERIGLGSYGEVYRGNWHGADVAVKRFLDQDLSGIALEEFKTEV